MSPVAEKRTTKFCVFNHGFDYSNSFATVNRLCTAVLLIFFYETKLTAFFNFMFCFAKDSNICTAIY